MRKAEIKAKVSTGIIPYVASVENVEIAGIESAFEVALKEYTVANDEVKEAKVLVEKISNKVINAQEYIEKIVKEIRKTEGSYKRSTKRETLRRLYNRMVELRGELEECKVKEKFLQRMYREASKDFNAVKNEKYALGQKVIEAVKQAGLKYCVEVQDFNGEEKYEHVKTVAEAVSFIYMNAEGLRLWQIRKLGLCTIARGTGIDRAIFEDLINGFDEKYIDAEIAPVSEKVEYTPATLEEEFYYIEVKAIHNFTFDKYIESIEELKKFVSKANGELKETALSELKEWIEIARAEGFEVEDYKEESAVDGWEVVKDGAGIYDWTYYRKYPVEGYGVVEIKNANNTRVYSVSCSIGDSRNTVEFFINRIAKTSDILVFITRLDGLRNTHGGDSTFCGGHYDATFFKGTAEENKAAAFAYASYIVEYLMHFEKTSDGYILNQEYLRYYIYGDNVKSMEESAETISNDAVNDAPKKDSVKCKITNEMLGLTFSKIKNSNYYYCNFKAMQIGEKYFPARRIYVGASSRNAEYEIDARKAAARIAIDKNLPITPEKTIKARKTFESGLATSLFSEDEETPKETVIKFEAGKYYTGESPAACNAYVVYKCVSRSEDKVTLQESWLINEVGEKVEMRGDIGTFKVTVHRGEHEEVRLEKRRYVWARSLYEVAEETTPQTEETVSKAQYWSYELTRIIPPNYENLSFLDKEYVEKLRAKYEAMEKEIIGYKEELGDSGKYRIESVVYSYGYDNELKERVSRCRVLVEYTDDENRGWTATASQIWLNSYSVKTDATTGEVVDQWGSDKKSMLDSLFKALPEVKKNAEDETCAKNNTNETENTFRNVLICPTRHLKYFSREKLLGKIRHALKMILGRIRGNSP